MALKTLNLIQRKADQARREIRIQAAFLKSRELRKGQKQAKAHKLKSVDTLLSMLSIDKSLLIRRALHDPQTYTPRSCNLDKQLQGLISHIFAEYPAPAFLYPAFLGDNSCSLWRMNNLFQEWFVAIAQGESFAKLVKGLMTKKEAHLFLTGQWHGFIYEKVWWAKLRGAGVPDKISNVIVKQLLSSFWIDDYGGRAGEAVAFYASNYAAIGERHLPKTCDFIRWAYERDKSFHLKGRTASSVLEMTRDWWDHYHYGGVDLTARWTGIGWTNWSHYSGGFVYDIVELRGASELLLEGRHQRHCVTTYVNSCQNKTSAIFSLRTWLANFTGHTDSNGMPIYHRAHEQARLTIEIDPKSKEIVQIKGKLNRGPIESEMRIVQFWAMEKRLAIPTWCDY